MKLVFAAPASLKQTAVCVVDHAGKIRREGMVASEPKAIADFIAAQVPQVVRIGLESGATSTWLWTELKKFGLPSSALMRGTPRPH
jgi:transposase